MKVVHVRLAVAAILFLSWIGCLFYLVVASHDAVILWRPQFLVADLWVIAEVRAEGEGPARTVKVHEVAWPARERALAGTTIDVLGLAALDARQGYTGPGEYILPLTVSKTAKGTHYFITGLPVSPGLAAEHNTEDDASHAAAGDKHIYPATPHARAQLRDLLAEWK